MEIITHDTIRDTNNSHKYGYVTTMHVIDRDHNIELKIHYTFINSIYKVGNWEINCGTWDGFTRKMAIDCLRILLKNDPPVIDPNPDQAYISDIERENYGRLAEQFLKRMKFSYKKGESQFSIMIDDEEGLFKDIKKILNDI